MDRTIIELGLSPAFLLLPTLLACAAAVVAGIWAVRARRAPMALRVASPGCVAAAIAFAAAGSMGGVFAAAVAALGVTVWMYVEELNRQMNRGEAR